MPRLPGGLPFVLLAALIFPFSGCAGRSDEVQQVVDHYIQAIQERDVQQVLDLSAPLAAALATEPVVRHEAVRKRFRQAVEARYSTYEKGKDEGRLDFHADGVVLTRALNLGRGAYYETVSIGFPAEGTAVLVQEVRLAYRSIDIFSLPVGTTIYLLGEPLGTIYNPVIGEETPALRRLLERVWLRWSLQRVDDRWLVMSVEPDPERPPDSYVDTTRF